MISRITAVKGWRPLGGAFAVALVMLTGTGAYIKVREELTIRAQAGLARRLIAAGKYDEAREPLESWLKARPRAAEAFFLLAREMFSADLMEQGFAALEKARALGYPPREIERQKAIIFAHLGRHEEAEPILRELLISSLRPDPEADKALAKCYFETFRFSEAEGVIERWTRDAPADVQPYLWRIELGRKINADPDIMLGYFEKALEVDASAADARIGLAELYLQRHQLDRAVAEYTAYSQLRPESLALYLGLGLVAMERGDEEEAIRNFEQAAKVDPSDVRPLIERGKLDLRGGRLGSALGFLDRALKIDASEAEVHYQRSLALTRMGRREEAKAAQAAASRLREEKEYVKNLFTSMMDVPGDVALQYKAASWLIDHGHGEEGVRWAEKILREQPRHAETNRLLEKYYEALGNRGLANFYRLQGESR